MASSTGCHGPPKLLEDQGAGRNNVSVGKADDVTGQAFNHGRADPKWTLMIQPRPASEFWKRHVERAVSAALSHRLPPLPLPCPAWDSSGQRVGVFSSESE
jgi:hypothetical protein